VLNNIVEFILEDAESVLRFRKVFGGELSIDFLSDLTGE
jgi:hypothetical protein